MKTVYRENLNFHLVSICGTLPTLPKKGLLTGEVTDIKKATDCYKNRFPVIALRLLKQSPETSSGDKKLPRNSLNPEISEGDRGVTLKVRENQRGGIQ